MTQTLETMRIAKAVCKKLQVTIPVVLERRPRDKTGYTMLQGYRSALALSVGACRALGMPEDEIRDAVQAALDGASQAAGGKGRDHG